MGTKPLRETGACPSPHFRPLRFSPARGVRTGLVGGLGDGGEEFPRGVHLLPLERLPARRCGSIGRSAYLELYPSSSECSQPAGVVGVFETTIENHQINCSERGSRRCPASRCLSQQALLHRTTDERPEGGRCSFGRKSSGRGWVYGGRPLIRRQVTLAWVRLAVLPEEDADVDGRTDFRQRTFLIMLKSSLGTGSVRAQSSGLG